MPQRELWQARSLGSLSIMLRKPPLLTLLLLANRLERGMKHKPGLQALAVWMTVRLGVACDNGRLPLILVTAHERLIQSSQLNRRNTPTSSKLSGERYLAAG